MAMEVGSFLTVIFSLGVSHAHAETSTRVATFTASPRASAVRQSLSKPTPDFPLPCLPTGRHLSHGLEPQEDNEITPERRVFIEF